MLLVLISVKECLCVSETRGIYLPFTQRKPRIPTAADNSVM